MTRQQLLRQILDKKSFLCVGLDSDYERLPTHLFKCDDPIVEFNRHIIESTRELCVAYKLNLAFYEAKGAQGWKSLEKTLELIPATHFKIADAKRGDIGNTSRQYARAFFENLDFDAVTVAPYMGEDSVKPFLGFEGKWVILLALTSNAGSHDFQLPSQPGETPLYEKVMRKAMSWGTPDNLMFVVGATHPAKFDEIRRIAPDHFLLVPGVGEQGGSLQQVSRYAINREVGILVNSSRDIIFAGSGKDFAEKAHSRAKFLQNQMKECLEEKLR